MTQRTLTRFEFDMAIRDMKRKKLPALRPRSEEIKELAQKLERDRWRLRLDYEREYE